MPDIAKMNAVAIADIEKVDSILAANIEKVNGLTFATAPAISAPAAAYSVRLLDTAVGVPTYTGACMRVRRASDNVEADVGFDTSDELSLTSPISNTSDAQSYTDFADFVDHTGTPTDGFCRYWYDQSGNAVHAGQSTAGSQPKIYDSSTGIIEEGSAGNEKPALDIRSVQNLTFSATNLVTGFVVGRSDTVNSVSENYMLTGTGRLGFNRTFAGSYSLEMESADGNVVTFGTATDTAQKLAYVNHQSGIYYLAQDGASTATVTGTVGNVSLLGNRSGNVRTYYTLNGTVQEVLIWTTEESSNRTGIETNIDNYYQIPGM